MQVTGRHKLLAVAIAVLCVIAAVILTKSARAGGEGSANDARNSAGKRSLRRSRSCQAPDRGHDTFDRRPVHSLSERRIARQGRRLHPQHQRRYWRPRPPGTSARCPGDPRTGGPSRFGESSGASCPGRNPARSKRRLACRSRQCRLARQRCPLGQRRQSAARPDRPTGTRRRHRQRSSLPGASRSRQVRSGELPNSKWKSPKPISSTSPRYSTMPESPLPTTAS